jgi:hypothetical protein
VGLVKTIDNRARRHRVAADAVPEGTFAGELGAMSRWGEPRAIPAWVVDGYLVTDRHRPPAHAPAALAAARWTLAPLRWRGFSERLPKARAMARRSIDSARLLRRGGDGEAPAPSGPPTGWLLSEHLPWALPLFAAYHPVTGDQLLTTHLMDAKEMGYDEPEVLGYVWPVAPVTGSLEQRVVSIPWASRFGLRVRRT